jgi:hypothetical protein
MLIEKFQRIAIKCYWVKQCFQCIEPSFVIAKENQDFLNEYLKVLFSNFAQEIIG